MRPAIYTSQTLARFLSCTHHDIDHHVDNSDCRFQYHLGSIVFARKRMKLQTLSFQLQYERKQRPLSRSFLRVPVGLSATSHSCKNGSFGCFHLCCMNIIIILISAIHLREMISRKSDRSALRSLKASSLESCTSHRMLWPSPHIRKLAR